jgi:hypothetical protein
MMIAAPHYPPGYQVDITARISPVLRDWIRAYASDHGQLFTDAVQDLLSLAQLEAEVMRMDNGLASSPFQQKRTAEAPCLPAQASTAADPTTGGETRVEPTASPPPT